MEDCLHSIGHDFDVIAISETWLDKESIIHKLVVYELCHQPRKNKNGGGVALYISNRLKFKVINQATTSIDNILECITVDIILNNSKNITVSCMYRQPGSSIDTCIDTMSKLFDVISKRKCIYLSGDFNINLLNIESHKGTKDFIDMLYSLGMYPLIDRPSRITCTSATLIDNIFTNELQHDHISGLLINDTSDHLPVFSIKKCNLERNPVKKFIMIRNNNKEAINAFGKALEEKIWDEVYENNDTNECFNTFLDYFTKCYNEHCPIRKVKISNKKKYKPWFTNGYKMPVKRKTICMQFS